MIIEDDRTAEQKSTHTCLVIMTDSFMSGWGLAEGGKSYAAWACKPEDASKVFNWVKSRGEARRVREVSEGGSKKWRPKGKGHAHIYVVDKSHRSLQDGEII